MPVRRRPAAWLVPLLAVLLLLPSAASAEVRSGTVDDPRDTPGTTDLRSVGVTYDTAGSVAVTVSLFAPVSDDYRRFRIQLTTSGMYLSAPSVYCSTNATGAAALDTMLNTYVPASFTVVGSGAEIPATRTVSADGLTWTFRASSPQLANRDYRCISEGVTYVYDQWGHCEPSYYPYYDDCDRISYEFIGDTALGFFFDGFAPVPAAPPTVPTPPVTPTPPATPKPPAPVKAVCEDGKDNDGDGKTDLRDPGCADDPSGTSERDPKRVASRSKITTLQAGRRRCALDVGVEVLPDLEPLEVFPFKRIKLTVKGLSRGTTGYRTTRRLRLGTASGYGFNRLRPGRYRVSLSYPGDRWRKPSKARSRSVRVC